MILQLSKSNRSGRNQTFTDIRSLRNYVKTVAQHPVGPNALKDWTLIAPADSIEFALNALPVLPQTIIVHGTLDVEAARRVRDTLGADRGVILL